MINKAKVENNLKLYLFTAALGCTVGVLVWLFLRLVGICTKFIWETVPAAAGWQYISVVICAVAGLVLGLFHKKYGNYPEELQTVIGKIKGEGHYDYGNMPALLISAFIPLVFGASVGPEAGLTGIIAGLCYWVKDNVSYAKEHAKEYSDIGAAVTLGCLFHVPLFGLFAVEESPDDGESVPEKIGIPKSSKIILYGISILTGFLSMKLLGHFFGQASDGFPSFEYYNSSLTDYLMILIYIPVGVLMYLIYKYSEKITSIVAGKIPAVLRETLCGICIGLMAISVPAVLFSGEEGLGELADTFSEYAPYVLMGLGVLKLIMTAFCIQFGLRGGHFFPLIFACAAMGFGISMAVFGMNTGHCIFGAAVVSAAALGAQLKKPIAVSMLLLLCFPIKMIVWIFASAAIGGRIGMLMGGKSGEEKEDIMENDKAD